MTDQDINFRFDFAGGALCGYLSGQGLQRLTLYAADAQPPALPLTAISDGAQQRRLTKMLTDYFAGKAIDLSAFPLDLQKGTAFQQRAWRGAQKIGYGQIRSYGALAEEIGSPKAARAIGTAMGANPILLLIPCHRVVAAGGALGGFGCGLPWKKRFLALEQGTGPWRWQD